MLNKSLVFLPALIFAAQSEPEAAAASTADSDTGSYNGKCKAVKGDDGLYKDSCGYNSFGNSITQLTTVPSQESKDEETGHPQVYAYLQYEKGAPGLTTLIDSWIQIQKMFDERNKGRTDPKQAIEVAAVIDCRIMDHCPSTGGKAPDGYSNGQLLKICEQAEFCAAHPLLPVESTGGQQIAIAKGAMLGCNKMERIHNLNDPEQVKAFVKNFYEKHCSDYTEQLEIGGMPAWLIAVIVIVVLFLLTIIIGGTVWYMKRRSAVGQGNREEIEEAKLQDLHDNYEDYGDEDVDEQNVKAATREPALE